MSKDSTLTSIEDAEKLLSLVITAAKQNKTIYLVLDGLDECGKVGHKKIAAWFQGFNQKLPANEKTLFRCLFVSQDDGTKKSFTQVSQLKLVQADTIRDIESFAAHRHKDIESRFGPLTSAAHNISKIVPAKAQGIPPTLGFSLKTKKGHHAQMFINNS